MVKIYFFIPDPEAPRVLGQTTPYRRATDRNVVLSRVPSVGEFVSLGNDTTGVAANYEVVLVLHAAGRPNETDAEVYLNRVDMIAVTKALASKQGQFDVRSNAFPESLD